MELLSEPEAKEGEEKQYTLEHDAGEQAAQKKDKLVGQTIGQYRILDVIGKGGMGTVYKAEHLKPDRTCALKILSPELVYRDQIYVDRFLREARSAAGLNNPNVVLVYNVGSTEDTYFIEMEYVKGKSLQEVMSASRGLSFDRATYIAACVARALSAAQENDLVHRDIKPDNILLGDDGSVKVTDFGLAKTVETATHITQTGSVMGTPYFMAPEQCEGEEADGRSDTYALGATYYYMLTGRLPFVGKTALAIMYKQKHDPVPDIRRLRPEFPDAVQDFLAIAMAKKPEDRFQTAAEMLTSIEALAEYEVETPLSSDNVHLPTPSTAFDHSEPPPPTQTSPIRKALADTRIWRAARPHNVGAVVAGVTLGLLVLWAFARHPAAAPAAGLPQAAPADQPSPQPEPTKAEHTAGPGAATSGSAAKGATPRPAASPKPAGTKTPAKQPGRIVVRQDGRGAYRSIADALRHAKSGATIVVHDDASYASQWPKQTALRKLRDVSIQVAKGRAPTVTLDQRGPPLALANGWRLSGLKFAMHPDRAAPAIHVTGQADVDGCLFVGGQRSITWASRALNVHNCVFQNEGKGVVLEVVDSTESKGLRKLRFTHNSVHRWAVAFSTPCQKAQNVRAELADNIFSQVSLLIHENPLDLMPWPPLLWRTHHNCYWQVGEYFRQGGKRTLVQAKVLADWRAVKSADRNSFEADPSFIDAKARRLQLKPSSPCKGKASDRTDLGAMWAAERWAKWLAAKPAHVAAAPKGTKGSDTATDAPKQQDMERRKARLAVGRLWKELSESLAQREYAKVSERCDSALKQTQDKETVARLNYWKTLAYVGNKLAQDALARAGELVGKDECTLTIRRGRGKQRLKAHVLRVEKGVITLRYGENDMDVPVAQLGADSLLGLTRKPGPQTPDRLLAEATFYFAEGDAKEARKLLSQIPQDAASPGIAKQMAALTEHWDAVLEAQQAIAQEEEADRAAQELVGQMDSGQTGDLDRLCQDMETKYKNTAAYAKVRERIAGARLLVAGDAILERVRPRSTKRFAPAEIRRAVERRMESYRGKEIVVKKDGPIKTIAAAVRAVTERTKIVIADSETYPESISITKPGLMIRAADGARPTIAPRTPDYYAVSVRAADVVLFGLNIEGGRGLSFSNCKNGAVAGCRVSGVTRGRQTPSTAIQVDASADFIVADNTVVHNEAYGIYLKACPNAVATNNRCVGNAGTGIMVKGNAVLVGNLVAYNGMGIGLTASTQAADTPDARTLVEGNVVWRNMGIGVWGHTWPANTVFRHNLVACNAGVGLWVRQAPEADSAVTNNVLCANWHSQLMVNASVPGKSALLIKGNVISGFLSESSWPAATATPALSVVDRNLLFSPSTGGRIGETQVTSLEQWQKITQQSLNSRWSRPAFERPERYDLRLQRAEGETPAWGLPAAASLAKQLEEFRPVMDDPAALQAGLSLQSNSRRKSVLASTLSAKVSQGSGGQFKTIAAALAKAQPGTIIEIIDSAVYNESVVIDKSRIVLRARPNARPVVHAPKDAAFAVSVQAQGVAVIGLKVIGGENGILAAEGADSVLIADNSVHNASEVGIYATKARNGLIVHNLCFGCKDGIAVDRSSAMVVLGNRCVANQGEGLLAQHSSSVSAVGNICYDNALAGLMVDSCQGVSVVNNLCYANKGHGISCRNAADLFVEHNTAYSNAGAGLHAEALQEWVRITGNVLAKNKLGMLASDWARAAPLVVSWNGVHGNRDGYGKWDDKPAPTLAEWQQASGLGQQSTTAAPDFQSVQNVDFRIRKTGPYGKKAPDGGPLGVRWADETWDSYMKEAGQTDAEGSKKRP